MKKQSDTAPARSVAYVLVHGGLRAIGAFVLIVTPFYIWIWFYYLSTGAYKQPVEVVAMNAPVFATLYVPLLLAAWVIGFRGKYVFIVAVAALVLSSWLPPGISNQLLPGSYIRLAIGLVLLAAIIRVFEHWRNYMVLRLPVADYTRPAKVLTVVFSLGLIVLLLPIAI